MGVIESIATWACQPRSVTAEPVLLEADVAGLNGGDGGVAISDHVDALVAAATGAACTPAVDELTSRRNGTCDRTVGTEGTESLQQ